MTQFAAGGLAPSPGTHSPKADSTADPGHDAVTHPANDDSVVVTELSVSFLKEGSSFRAVGPVDLTIPRGQFLCVVGPSGCGKSTLLRAIGGLQGPTEGRVDLNLDRGTDGIATIFQDYGVFPWLSVVDNAAFGLRGLGVPKRQARDRAMEWLAKVGIADFARAWPHTLSGGMRQRVAIARAFATDPELLLLDEPFAALDAQIRELMQEFLLQLCEREPRTVVLITHSIEEALVLGDRVVVMSQSPGEILDDITVPFSHPRDGSVRESRDFAEYRSRIWQQLRTEVNPHARLTVRQEDTDAIHD